MLSCFFVTGTGRCGTLLLSKILNTSSVACCNHEHSIDTKLMKKSFFQERPSLLEKDLQRVLIPAIRVSNTRGKTYGECSAHLYPHLPTLFRRYEHSTRFVLLTRRPDAFIRSALARGFFSPDHPHGLEHVVPPRKTLMGEQWVHATSFEKCAWYWATVNGIALRFFSTLPSTMYKVIAIEKLTMDVIENLYDFLSLNDFSSTRQKIETLLSSRHNATPGQGDGQHLNPYSEKIELGTINTWDSDMMSAYRKHVIPLEEVLYPTEKGKEENLLSTIIS